MNYVSKRRSEVVSIVCMYLLSEAHLTNLKYVRHQP